MTRSPSASATGAGHRRFPALSGLRRRWRALDRVQRGLLLLLLLRWIIDAAFLLNVLPLAMRSGWHLHQGGDNAEIFELARSIVIGAPEESVVGLGQAIVMMPWIALFNAYLYPDIAAPMSLFDGFLLGGLSVLLVGALARTLTRDGRTALGAAAVWAVLPLVAYFGFFWHPHAEILASTTVPKVAWLNGLSDGPTVFILMIATLLLARVMDEREIPFGRSLAVGLLLGLALMWRLQLAPMVAFLLLYVLVAHGWRAFAAALGGALIGYLPQAAYNMSAFGLPFTAGYISYGDIVQYDGTFKRPLSDILLSLPFHPVNPLSQVVYFVGRRPWLLVPLIAGLAVGAAVFIALWRERGWRTVALLLGAPLAYQLPIMATDVFREDAIRLSMPLIPGLIIAAVYVVLLIVPRLSQLVPSALRGDAAHKE
jgi:hypothetical protein